LRLEILRQGDAVAVRFEHEGKGKPRTMLLQSRWQPGQPLWNGLIDGEEAAVHVRLITNGFLLSHRGVREKFHVYTKREAEFARLMPVKASADSGKLVRSPMPGLVLSVAVAAGQEVKAGETIAVVEAMKMENVLRAERDGTVKTIHVKPGESVAVDAAVVEFA
jgi:propionyl-CoA carboxylase alpha chain